MGLRGHKAAVLSTGQAVRLLVALIGPTHVAVPAHWVRGIITVAEAGRDGVVTWANSLYEMTNLAGRLTIQSKPATAETRLILYGNAQKSRSFTVDKVLGLVDVSRAEIHPLPTQFRGGERERLLGFFIDAAYVALIANPFWVLELPMKKDALDVFMLQVSDRQTGAADTRNRLPGTVLNAAVPIPAGHVK